jgi:WD40 repeat protein
MLDEPAARKVKLGGCSLRSAALTRVSLHRFWSSSLIDGQKKAGFCPLDKLHTSVSYPLRGHTDWVQSVAFRPDGQTLASGSSDKKIKLWGKK